MAAERERPIYTKDQVAKYFERLRIPEQERVFDVASKSPGAALQYLSLLLKRHLVEIPFENLTLHYSVHHQVSLHPQALFKKIIADNNGRGGYCMENNCLFGTLLYTLGFHLYSAGARVLGDGTTWSGFGHMINFVTIGDTKYHVDVGFGAEGPIVPIPLDHSGTIQPHVKPATSRVQWRNIPGNVDPNQRLWVYEYRKNDDSDWNIRYCYTELEFLPQDYTVMNYYTSTSRHTFFTNVALAEKKIVGDNGDLAGNLSLFGKTLKRRMHGEIEEEIEFQTETERLEALGNYFGIRFGDAERDGISGLPSAIK